VSTLAPNTPVIVGVGFEQERSRDPAQCPEAYLLMTRAVQRAARDAGSEGLLEQIESISVPQGLWHYRNPGTLIAGALGCPGAKTIVSDLGVLQLTLLDELCRAVAAGEREIGVITGGERSIATCSARSPDNAPTRRIRLPKRRPRTST
jgi:acetyl-CoA C-acetyltransferase